MATQQTRKLRGGELSEEQRARVEAIRARHRTPEARAEEARVREPLEDVARNLERWVAALVIRTYAHEKVTTMAAATRRLHVINALTDEQHPCQALADMLVPVRLRYGRNPRCIVPGSRYGDIVW